MNTLRQRAWWLMRQQGTFTLNDLLTTLCDGTEKNAYHSLMKYVGLLERVGVLQRLKRKAPGLSRLSRGHVIWRLVRDLGRLSPVARHRDTVVFDPNSESTLTARAVGSTAAGSGTGPQSAEERIRDARQEVLQAVKRVQQREHCRSKRAVVLFLAEVQSGRVEPSLSEALAVSVMRAGGGGQKGAVPGAPSERTLIRWLTVRDLTPKSTWSKPEQAVQPWMVKALRIKRTLRHPTMQEVHRRLTRSWNSDWGEPVSYTAVRRFLHGKLKTVSLDEARSVEARATNEREAV
ncbi:MAG: hypothetical protein Q7J58_01690 [Hydrogenophaga sp.]|jgi:hypothetical protein|uniref:hypothetical protein n=1 Tax=Hydrogenophaga sp. TaxID=1904254 RepID=UPI0027188EBC|nr:hypothetical protein [Hydrogenophaga sp.]MDO9568082.1 hypothetical protein [Hydrogenophaga sp.]MDP3374363.1 hypothetical protein [Hydrogenophaga sp.]